LGGISDARLQPSYVRRIRTDGFVDPCIPSRAPKPPSGPDWVHEVKHDGYRLIVRRDGETVRLFTRRGHDWTDRYPAIAAARGQSACEVLHARRRGGEASGGAMVARRIRTGSELSENRDNHSSSQSLDTRFEVSSIGPLASRSLVRPSRALPHRDAPSDPERSAASPHRGWGVPRHCAYLPSRLPRGRNEVALF
jgi:hypothetical protein